MTAYGVTRCRAKSAKSAKENAVVAKTVAKVVKEPKTIVNLTVPMPRELREALEAAGKSNGTKSARDFARNALANLIGFELNWEVKVKQPKYASEAEKKAAAKARAVANKPERDAKAAAKKDRIARALALLDEKEGSAS